MRALIPSLFAPGLFILVTAAPATHPADIIVVRKRGSLCSPLNSVTSIALSPGAALDGNIQTLNILDPNDRKQVFASGGSLNAGWVPDDMPVLGVAKQYRRKRSVSGIFDTVGNWVENNPVTSGIGAGVAAVATKLATTVADTPAAVANVVENPLSIGRLLSNTVIQGGRTVFSCLNRNCFTLTTEEAGVEINVIENYVATQGTEAIVADVTEGVVGAALGKRSLEKKERRDVPISATTVCTEQDCAGANFTTFSSLGAKLTLRHAGNGNIYSLNTSTTPGGTLAYRERSLFAGMGNSTFSDSFGRLLHGYANELAQYGFSRLRLSPVTTVPVGSLAMSFVSANHPKGWLFVADDAGTVYHLVTCVFKDALPTVFIAKEFRSNASTAAVMAGKPMSCNLLPYIDDFARTL